MHPDIRPLAFLAGTWEGTGAGEYPTIEPFRYTERITFVPGPDKPFLAYTQTTRHGTSDLPLHAEMGYLRASGDAAEWVIAQPTGLVEVLTGTISGTSVTFTGVVHTTPTAREVRATTRTYRVDGETLRYELAMEAVGQPMTHHLSAEFTRVDDR